MNKADLVERIAPELGGRAEATKAIEVIVDAILREVAAGGTVGVTGFGTFEKIDRAPRTGRTPRTGTPVPIEATCAPRFRPGTYFKKVVSDPGELPEEGLAGVRVGKSDDDLVSAADKGKRHSFQESA
jgi:DNA-binding protein HU-beta